MNLRQFLAVATAATLLVPGTALAGKGNGKPNGKHANPGTFTIRTLEGPESSPEVTPVPTTESPEVVEAPAPAPDQEPTKARGKSAQAKANARAKKAAKRACKGLSKKRVKGKKGTPYSRCIVSAAKRLKQPVVEPAPLEPAPTIDGPTEQPTAPVVEEPAPTEPVETTDPVEGSAF